MENNNHQLGEVKPENESHTQVEPPLPEDKRSIACIFPTLTDKEPLQSLSEQTVISDSIPLNTFLDSEEGITINNFLETLWCIILYRFADTDDLLFGIDTPSPSCQNGNGVNDKLGSELQICKVSMDKDRLVRDLLGGKHFQQHPISAFSPHSYNTGIVVQNECPAQNGIPVDETKPAIGHKQNFDVALIAVPNGESLQLLLRYQTSTLSNGHAKNLASNIEEAVKGLQQTKDRKAIDVNLFSQRNRAEIARWYKPRLDIVEVHEHIFQQRLRWPGATAVDSWDGTLSYQELDRQSSIVADYLMEFGIGVGTLAPLCFGKSKWAIIALLALQKSGAAFVPLDPSHPSARLKAITKQINARYILTSAEHRDRLAEIVEDVIIIDQSATPQSTHKLDFPRLSIDTEAPAYVLFTSGSTGAPKGCVVDKAAFSTVIRHAETLHINSASRVIQFASLSFGVSLIEIWCTLTAGGTVCIPSDHDRLNDVTGAMTRLNVNWAILTPSLVGSLDPQNVSTLQTLALAGELPGKSQIAPWIGRVRVMQAYGLTEWCGICFVNPNVESAAGVRTIGRPSHANIWLVDPEDHQRPAPIGAVAELIIEGPSLAKGYFNDTSRTSETFISTPDWIRQITGHSHQLYKTGDLVQFNSDGTLQYVVRRGVQVKIRGQRVELGEVEHHVQSCFQNVTKVLAEVVLPTGKSSSRLVAFIYREESTGKESGTQSEKGQFAEPRDEFLSEAREANSKLQQLLPAHMIPEFYIPLNHIPLTVSSKTDRRLLREKAASLQWESYDFNNVTNGVSKKQPETQLEKKFRDIFAQVLKVDAASIGVDDSFFVFGDSIAAMQVISKCRIAKISLTVQDVFHDKTVSRLAQTVQRRANSAAKTHSASFSLTPTQELFFGSVRQYPNQYTQSMLLRLENRIRGDTVESAISTLVKRHSMLRDRFIQSADGRWSQFICAEGPLSYRYREREVSEYNEIQIIGSESEKCLDIKTGPVFAADFITVKGDDKYLFLVAHSFIMDMVSWDIIMQDLEELFKVGELSGENYPSFQTWNDLQYGSSSALTSPRKLPDINFDYWDISNVDLKHCDAEHHSFVLPEEVSESLLGQCNKAFNTEPTEIIHAGLLHSFAKVFSDRDPPTVFNIGHGRVSSDPTIDPSNIVGCFEAIWPAQASVKNEHDIVEAVRRTKDARRKAAKDDGQVSSYRYEVEKSTQCHPPFEIIFHSLGLEKPPQSKSQGPKLLQREKMGITAEPDSQQLALFEVSVSVVQDRLQVSFLYNKNMNRQDSIGRWVVEFEQTLKEAAQQLATRVPEPTLIDLPFLLVERENIESVYRCSPVQQGILLSRAKDAEDYQVRTVWRISTKGKSGEIDLDRLQAAWKKVVAHHSILRSIVVENAVENGYFHTVVLKTALAKVSINTLSDSSPDPLRQIYDHKAQTYDDNEPPNQLSVYKSSTGIFCVLDTDHAFIDATSITVMMRDFVAAYDALLSNSPGPSFEAYSAYLHNIPKDSTLEYWKSYLTGVDACLFPKLEGKSPTAIHRGQLRTLDIELEIDERIQNFCKSTGGTLSNLFQLAWAMVLRCYAGTNDVCFGYLTSGRDVPLDNIENAVGPYINMLITRFQLGDKVLLADLVNQNQQEYIQSLSYQYCTLADIFHSINVAGQTIFNTIFSFRRSLSPKGLEESELNVECIWEQSPTEYDISVNVVIEESSAIVTLNYWTTTLSDGQAANVAETFSKAVGEIADKPNGSMQDVDLLSEQDMNQLQTWNGTSEAVDACAHQLIQQKSLEQLESPAVCAWNGDFTYAELNNLSSLLARHLISFGVSPEVFIPLCFEKSKWVVVAMLGVMKAGGAFVLLDPSHPKKRLQEIVGGIGCTVMVSSKAQATLSADLAHSVIILDDSETAWRKSNTRWSGSAVHPNNVIYAVYTSGSTGKPKGVVIEHTSFTTGAVARSATLGLNRESRVLQFVSHAFDVSISDILMTLIAGGCICVPSEDERTNLAETIEKFRASFACLTPSVIRAIHPDTVPSLKTLVVGGEPLSQMDISTWSERIRLICEYGPAECSVGSCIQPSINTRSTPADIGYAVGCTTWIVDRSNHERLVPIGTVGELLVEGPIVGREYLNNVSETMKSFIKAPQWLCQFRKCDQIRVYKTGDVARYNSNGSIQYIGRKDMQIKLRGQRIELGEVEHYVRECFEDVKDVVAELIVAKGSDHAMLAAFVLSENDHSRQAANGTSAASDLLLSPDEEFRSKTKEAKLKISNLLPVYMVPTVFLPVHHLPLTNSGKVDRHRLRQSAAELPRGVFDSILAAPKVKTAPSTNSERLLQKLVAETLNQELSSIGMEDDFFELGGDSSTAMKLVGVAREAGIPLMVREVFLHPKLANLALKCKTPDSLVNTTNGSLHCSSLGVTDYETFIRDIIGPQVPGGPGNVSDVAPTTEFQTETIVNWPCTYFLVSLTGAIDKSKLQSACEGIVNHHSVLRSVFLSHGVGFVQVVLRHLDIEYSEEKIDGDITSYAENISQSDSTISLALGVSPVKFTLIQQNDTQHILIIRLSHAQYDGYSMPIIYHDLVSAYQGNKLSATVSFPDYARHSLLQKTTTAYTTWQDVLKDSTMTQIQTIPASIAPNKDMPSLSNTIIEAHEEIPLPTPPAGITMATLLRSASAFTLMQLTNQKDVTFGQVVNGRNLDLQGVENIVGPCLNIIPTRAQIDSNWPVSHLLTAMHNQHVQTMAYDTLGLNDIAHNSTTWANNTQLGMMIQHQNIDMTPQFSMGEGITCAGRAFSQPYKRSYLHVVTVPRRDSLFVYVSCPTHMMSCKQQLRQFLQKLLDVTVSFSYHPDKSLGEFENMGFSLNE